MRPDRLALCAASRKAQSQASPQQRRALRRDIWGFYTAPEGKDSASDSPAEQAEDSVAGGPPGQSARLPGLIVEIFKSGFELSVCGLCPDYASRAFP